MVGLKGIQDFASFLLDAYGAVSSILIFVVFYLVYQLRAEQKENRDAKTSQLHLMEKNVEIQITHNNSIHEMKNAIMSLQGSILSLHNLVKRNGD